MAAGQGGGCRRVGARGESLNFAGEVGDLKTKELGSAEDTVPVAASTRHVNETFIRDVLKVSSDIHLIDKVLIIVFESENVFLDSPRHLGQSLKFMELSNDS